jgi:hypothetical protein
MPDSNEQRLPPALERLARRPQWLAWEFRDAGNGKKARKVPINPFTGRAGSSSDPASWASYEFAKDFYSAHFNELAGLGYAFTDDDPECGVTSDGITAVDIDGCINDKGEIDEWILPLLAETYCEITPSEKGLHFLVDGKWDLGGKRSRIFKGARIEIYRGRRYFSVTGKQVAGSSNDINPAPILMAALFKRGEELATADERKAWTLEAEFAEKVPNNDPPKPKTDITKREREYALESLTKAADEVAAQREMRNNFLNAKAYHLGTMVGAGWIEEAPIFAAFEGACRQNGLWKDDGPTQCRKSIRSGLRKGRLAPRGPLDDRHYDPAPISDEEVERAAESAQDAPKGDRPTDGQSLAESAQATPAEPQQQPLPGLFDLREVDGLLPFPPDLTNIQYGVMGDIIDWLLENKLTPNRTSAFVIALGVMINFTARHFIGPSETGTGLHAYIAFLGGTGSGKASIHRWIREITDYVCDNPPKGRKANNKFKSRIKPGRYTSASTLERHIKTGGAASMLFMDEIGDIISTFNGPRSSEHMRLISTILMDLWGINTGKYEATAYVDDVGKGEASTIKHPAVSIVGLSTHDKFWSAFSGIDIKSGFANRFLIIQMPSNVTRKNENESIANRKSTMIPIPRDSIVEQLTNIGEFGAEPIPMLERPSDNKDIANPILVDWEDDEVLNTYNRHCNMIADYVSDHPKVEEYVKRTSEQAVRLATIMAISCGRLKVSREDMLWGIGVANYSAQALYSGASKHIAGSQHEALINRIVEQLGMKGQRGRISRAEIQRNNKKYRPREIDDAICSAVDAEIIRDCTSDKEKEEARKGNHRVKRVYGRGLKWDGAK